MTETWMNASKCQSEPCCGRFYTGFYILGITSFSHYTLCKKLQLWGQSGQSKFRCNIFISLFLTLWETLYNFFQVSWWSLDCVWKWYRNHISNLLFWTPSVKSGNIARPFMLRTLTSEPIWMYLWTSVSIFAPPGESVLLSIENANLHVPSLQFGGNFWF